MPKRAAADQSNVVDAREHLEKMREEQWKVVQAAEARLAQLDAALASLRLPDGMIVRSADYAGMGIVEAAAKFLKEKGDGKTTRQIADGMRERGLTTTAKKWIATVYATLHNAEKTFQRKGGKWYLKRGAQ